MLRLAEELRDYAIQGDALMAEMSCIVVSMIERRIAAEE
jgi:hypothetical protein